MLLQISDDVLLADAGSLSDQVPNPRLGWLTQNHGDYLCPIPLGAARK